MIISPTSLRLLTRWEFSQFIVDALSFLEPKVEEMPASFTEKLSQTRRLFDIYDIEIALERCPDSKLLLAVEEECNYAIRTIYKVLHAYKSYKYNPEKEIASKE